MMRLAYKNNSGSNGNNKNPAKEFEFFFRKFYGKLCDFAARYVNNADVAEDIVQSVFMNLWERRELWEDLENAKAYLYKSVRNEALNYLKHERVVQKTELEVRLRFNEWKGTSKDTKDLRKLKSIIQEGISNLPKRRQKIYRLSRESGLTYQEIAEVLGISIKTVETQIGRSLKSLRSFVSTHWQKLVIILLTNFLL